MSSWREIAGSIEPPSELWRQRARAHVDRLTKPLGSLGQMEDLAAQIVAIRQEKCLEPMVKGVYVFAADHGVTAEGVSAYPREVTHQMVLNFLRGGAAINVLAGLHHAALQVIDVGVDADFAGVPGLLHRKVARGTANMLHGPAMTEEQMERALAVGVEAAESAVAAGQNVIAIGEMGIGNTTSASAMTCALMEVDAASATGRGTGLGAGAHLRKVEVVAATLRLHFRDSGQALPLDILRCVGGFEIAAMAGMMLGAARHRLVIVLDGFISTAAAAIAVGIAPQVRGYLVAGHRSEEPGHRLLLEWMGLSPVLSLKMRLGEGTGAVLAMPVLESAMACYREMATFASAGVSEAS